MPRNIRGGVLGAKCPENAAAAAFLALAVFFLGGCASHGPAKVKADRFDYNTAIAHTGNEQLLLNLVRLKYRDPPLFLQVSNVASQYTFSGSAEAGAGFASEGGEVYSLGAGVGYSEAPTVSLVPLQGEEFVQRLLSPISLEALSLLTRGGWSVERVMRSCVQRVNDIHNAPSASGPTPGFEPRYREFQRVAAELRTLQVHRATRLARVAGADDRILGVLRLEPDPEVPETVAAAERFKQLLGLPPEKSEFEVSLDPAVQDPAKLTVVTRSLLGMLYYLSQGVEVPPSHVAAGYVTVTRDEEGNSFDWDLVTGNLFRVKSALEKPERAFVKIFYRGSWYFIDDADLESKTTFGLASMLFDLQAGSSEQLAPVLTLPVGR